MNARWPTLYLLLAVGVAHADTIEGRVIAAHGRDTGHDIVTDVTVRGDDGREVVVSELGGHAGSLTMRVWHGPPALAVGMRARVTAHPSLRPGAPMVLDDAAILDDTLALPYVRTPADKSGRPLYWAKSCVEVAYAQEGTAEIAGDAEFAVLDQAIQTWNDGVAGCAYLNLVPTGRIAHEVGKDRTNLIKFRDTEWCRPAVDGEDMRCFSHSAAALTTVVYVDDPADDRDGEIIDADMELNGVDFAISINGQTLGRAGCQADLANTVTHELGHMLGLDHTCRASGEPARTDGAGRAVPLCTDTTDPLITEATMYPYQACGETKKSSLTADDTGAICAVYPTAQDPGACEAPDALGAGCCSSGGGPAGPAALAAIAGLVLARPRRRQNQ